MVKMTSMLLCAADLRKEKKIIPELFEHSHYTTDSVAFVVMLHYKSVLLLYF